MTKKPMRILIDCTQVIRNKTGVSVYALNMLRELVCVDRRVEYFLLVQNDDADFEALRQQNVHFLRAPAGLFRKMPLRFLLEQLCIPLLAIACRIDLVHSLHYSLPLLPLRAKKVVSVHDLTSMLMPEMHIPSKGRYYRFFIRKAARFADGLLFISQSTADDFRRLFPVSSAQKFVTPLGKSSLFCPEAAQGANTVLRRYGITKPYILYVGTLEPRKNLIRLVQSFQPVVARHPDYQLVLAGKLGWMSEDLLPTIERCGLRDRVLLPGFVSEEDKPQLIAACDVFAYPSLYEGFGIPLLEAMSCGVPTLSSRTSSMVEVGGEGALLVDPTSVTEISEGMERLVSDEPFREALRTRALEQAARFTWKRTAELTLAAYRAMLADGSNHLDRAVHRRQHD